MPVPRRIAGGEALFERFVQRTPVTVLARAAMEHAMAPEALDALFAQHADKQYTRELLFSSVVDFSARQE